MSGKLLQIKWTYHAQNNTVAIARYLKAKFSDKEVVSFYLLLSSFEKTVVAFPKLYPETLGKKLIRRAVLKRN